MRSGLFVLLSVFSAALPLGGCARVESAADRHRTSLSEDLDDIQADQDGKVERLGGEVSAPRAKSAPGSAPRAVQLGEGAAAENDDPNDPSTRPEIRVIGTPSGRTTRLRTHEPESPSGSTPRSSSSDSPKNPALDPDARKAYDAAIGLVNEKKYDKALDALSSFLVSYPDHPYAENATYWRGEVYFAKGDYAKAKEQFEAVVSRGLGTKTPDALLKIGMCQEKLGASDKARESFDRLRREHPKSDAARKIPSDTRGPKGPKESR